LGDIVYFNYYIEKDGGQVEWDVFSGTIDRIIIEIDDTGYVVSYHTDEHKEGEVVYEEDIIDLEQETEEEEEEHVISQAE
jgi:hypothetical protein